MHRGLREGTPQGTILASAINNGWKLRSSVPMCTGRNSLPKFLPPPSQPTSPFQNQAKEQQKFWQLGKMDKGSQAMITEEHDGAPLACDKNVVPPKPTRNPLESLHPCQSCCVSELLPTFSTGSGALGCSCPDFISRALASPYCQPLGCSP